MADFSISLTATEVKALQKMYDTDDLGATLQENAKVTVGNYMRDQYKAAILEKSTADLKKIVPNVKIEREVPEVPEPEEE